jgi:hypothetical protein
MIPREEIQGSVKIETSTALLYNNKFGSRSTDQWRQILATTTSVGPPAEILLYSMKENRIARTIDYIVEPRG